MNFWTKTEAEEDVNNLEAAILSIKGVKTIHLYRNSAGNLVLSQLIIVKEHRKQGIGSDVMKRLCEYADENSMTFTLTPATRGEFGATSKSRLIKFYKRFGFVLNKGRNKDFSISDTMLRRPLVLQDQ